jgi:hypothetical protein
MSTGEVGGAAVMNGVVRRRSDVEMRRCKFDFGVEFDGIGRLVVVNLRLDVFLQSALGIGAKSFRCGWKKGEASCRFMHFSSMVEKVGD